jgi:hypothetical protein
VEEADEIYDDEPVDDVLVKNPPFSPVDEAG